MGQSYGVVLANVRSQIHNLYVLDPEELGKGVRDPDGLWEFLLGKNEILVFGKPGVIRL